MFHCTGLSRRLLGLVLVVVPCQFCGCSDLCVLCADALCSPQGPSALDLPPGPTPAPSPAPSPVIWPLPPARSPVVWPLPPARSPVVWPLPRSDPNPSSGVAHTICHRPQGTGDAFAFSICCSAGVRDVDGETPADAVKYHVRQQLLWHVRAPSNLRLSIPSPGHPLSKPEYLKTPCRPPSSPRLPQFSPVGFQGCVAIPNFCVQCRRLADRKPEKSKDKRVWSRNLSYV